MIGRLKGTLVAKQPPWIMVDVGGVGYEMEAPMSTFYDLPEVGQPVTLCTHYAVKEDSVALYGFLRESERSLFRGVQKVSGIGAKIALAVLSGVSAEDFARFIESGDVASLVRIPGVGKKTAERMIVELRDRVDGLVDGSSSFIPGNPPKDPISEASVALQSLGYKPNEVTRLVRDASAPGDSAEDIIRKALKAALR
ncbi:Holliday junction branch migration protein RuvA [Dokdonella sp.]|uniref:Holliday junction branch migration protein RuvA n=1 Tax=Dokdonella sp. TaxID=2291710 RepID=UPI0035272B87